MPKSEQKNHFADSLGRAIRAIRKDQKLSVAAAAEKIGMTPNQLYQYESGQRSPSIDVFCRILRGLKCSCDEVLKDSQNHE